MKTQKKAHQVSVRVVILLAMLCILTFFCSATIYVHAAPVSSKSDISEASGSSKEKCRTRTLRRIFSLILLPMPEVPACRQV